MVQDEIKVKSLRESLKELMQREIDNLPALLDQMEPKERINVICRLMPFVFPKLEAINANDGEPVSWDM
ncbi:MAG: hypothetical protein VB075_19240 [Petrimonas sp.]|uniref:hypothetical protein n=1 Tax=Petrimonas sp. TaxID=2023866 RepID=UPI002B3BC059|nr:hypothetical protein [Bacteroidaceae bacterium]MEA5046687.1 hypothetical protein [Petrimonas sp.]